MENLIKRLIVDGYVPVNIKENNVQIKDNVVNRNGLFGTLKKVNKKGYGIRYDVDYAGESLTYFTAKGFEQSFLVDKSNEI